MKAKKIKKKLVLNKISIVHLDSDKINELKGGIPLIQGDFLANSVGFQACSPQVCQTTPDPPCTLDESKLLICTD